MESNQFIISIAEVKQFIDSNFEKNVASTYRSSISGFGKVGADFNMVLKQPVFVAVKLKANGVERQRASTLFKNLKTVLHKMLDDPIMKDKIGDVDTTIIYSFNNNIIKPVFGELNKNKNIEVICLSRTDEESVAGEEEKEEDKEEEKEEDKEEKKDEEKEEDNSEKDNDNSGVLAQLRKIEQLIAVKEIDRSIAFDGKRMQDLKEANTLLEDNNKILMENNKRLEGRIDMLLQTLQFISKQCISK